MKISWNWLREWLPTKQSVSETAALLTDIGLEVESVTPYESIRGSLAGLIVAEVMHVEKHPDADRLMVTRVNTGSGNPVQVVCGAPNVAVGQKVIFAPVGTTIFPMNNDPITIKKTKIRGVESEGMLCAEDEIGLGHSHDGLYILPNDYTVGTALKDFIPIYSDTIFEIGLTANHADAFSHYGVAREVQAALHIREIEKVNLDKSELQRKIEPVSNTKFEVEVEDTQRCIRYSGLLIHNVTISESPAWLKDKLNAIGVRSINNVVDISNYVLHAIGQPLHMFNADAIRGNKIIVKTLAEGTPFTTLDEKERKLTATDLMICDTESPLCIAGVFGGLHSGVRTDTKNIFIESACFSSKTISKTERIHELKTDAASRFSKGTDPEITILALHLAASLITEIAGGEIASSVFDIYPNKANASEIILRFNRLETLTALQIEKSKVIEILQSLHMEIIEQNNEVLKVRVPAYKNDVTREIDLIEEVLRMYGYDKVPVPKTIKAPFTLRLKPDTEFLRFEIGKKLTTRGFYELFTNPISRSKYIEKFAPALKSEMIVLKNSLNSELDCLRQEHLFSGLEVIQHNVNRKQSDLKLYEFGKTFQKQGNSFSEKDILVLYMCGNNQEESWKTKQTPVDFFELKKQVYSLCDDLGLLIKEIPQNSHPMLTGCISIFHNTMEIGYYGLIDEKLTTQLDIKTQVYYAAFNWSYLSVNSGIQQPVFNEIPRFPAVRRDLALILNPEITYKSVEEIAWETGNNVLRDVFLFDVYTGNNLEGKKSYAIGLTFRDDSITLTDTIIDGIMQKMITRYEKELQAVIRK